MITINLLHDTRRAGNRRRLTVIVCLLTVTLAVVVSSGVYLARRRAAVRSELAVVEIDLAAAAAQSKHLELAKKQRDELVQTAALVAHVIEERTSSPQLLEAIDRSLPKDVWLTSIKRSVRSIEIDGRTSSVSATSDFVQALAESIPFTRPPEIRSLSTEGAQPRRLMRFQVVGDLTSSAPKAQP